jgi:hypothetical protein
MALMGATSSNGRGKDMAGVIGISLQQQGNAFAVVGVLNGMPADEAGITRYMRIAAIDGISVSEMTIDQGMTRLRGAIGSTVSLTVLDGKGGSRTVSLVRFCTPTTQTRDRGAWTHRHCRNERIASSGASRSGEIDRRCKPGTKLDHSGFAPRSGGILQDYIATADVFRRKAAS